MAKSFRSRVEEEPEVHLHRDQVGALGDRLEPGHEPRPPPPIPRWRGLRSVTPGRAPMPAAQPCATATSRRLQSIHSPACARGPCLERRRRERRARARSSGGTTSASSAGDSGACREAAAARSAAARSSPPARPPSGGARAPAPPPAPAPCSSARQSRASSTGSSATSEAGLPQRDEVPGEVAAVHRRDVGRLEHAQVAEVVPVVEVPPEAPHAARASGRRAPAGGVISSSGDEAEVPRAHRRQELQADVGRRRAHRHHRLGLRLEVVRREPVGLRRSRTGRRSASGAARSAAPCRAASGGSRSSRRTAGPAQRMRRPRGDEPRQDQRQHRQRDLPGSGRRPPAPPTTVRHPTRSSTSAASATAGHIERHGILARLGRSPAPPARRSATRAGAAGVTPSRQSVRAIASTEIQAWCGEEDQR